MNNSYASITSIISDAHCNNYGLKYVENNDNMPYIEKNNVFYYFTRDAKGWYRLAMTSGIDIMWSKEK